MRRLTGLDSTSGPRVGPLVTIDAPTLGAYRPDIAFERAPDGSNRGVVLWTRRSTDSAYDVFITWFTDLGTDSPAFESRTRLLTGTSTQRFGTLIPVAGGMRALVRGNAAGFKVFAHAASAPLGSWTEAISGAPLALDSVPTGVALGSGELLGAAESDTAAHVVKVQRFSATGAPGAVELQLTGYEQPTMASDGTGAWLVMKRSIDGLVVSRQYTPASGWSATDRVELGVESSGYGWPNLLRTTDGRLRLVVRGPFGGATASVLAFQRVLGSADTTAPTLAATTLSKGTLSYTLSEPALVYIRVQTAAKAVRAARLVRKRGRRGTNRVRLGPVGAGRYRIVAVDAAGNRSRTKTIVLRARR
jgi:hypothetical protein